MLERFELETLFALADELHFGRAAARLHVSTGRVSQTLKQMERRIGTPLFTRTSRTVSITPAGQQLHDDLRPAYAQLMAALERAMAATGTVSGPLRVGYTTLWCGDLVVRAADLFRMRHPDVEVRIQEVLIHDPISALRTGELDLQLSEFPIIEPDITMGPVVLNEPRALLVPADHPLARQETVSLEDYALAPLITVEGAVPDYWLEEHFPSRTPSGKPVARGRAVKYWQEVLPDVSAGKGITTVCARAVHHHMHPGVAFVPFRDAPPIRYGLMWPTGSESARARLFMDTILEVADAARSAH
ncbi:LysR family transcriptional regulator [Streptomyces sp. NPDC001717]|uniref:LysR family transcriptional regulator n=1 Tax=Streptomyces sp. NPDC001717 TaxID=3364604 RepID=UPI003689E6BE